MLWLQFKMVTQGLKAQAPSCISHWWNNFDFGMHCLWKELSIWEAQFMIVMTYISTWRAISCQHEKGKKKVADKVDSGCCPPPPPEKLVKIEFVIWRCEVLPWLLFFFLIESLMYIDVLKYLEEYRTVCD